ncbi:MAG: alpha-ketoglutarate-dependent dioxygenase AlkB [Limimaricola sp.]|uniref:alpha-ketoglutarate-dependent dioxygenase AlkB n=1 Tax=Limimaricola sp. TaxID=2211665 RepID=UPI001D3CEDFE|nr:alpha-ketoglutarate-dependent dioxygenase AlkB [Limimaricola sp.]MBI1417161.1 alpha-ketoglutarate-dependent dioxygenase AlkB [Limimaricola sp.]
MGGKYAEYPANGQNAVPRPTLEVNGVPVWKGLLDRDAQVALLAEIDAVMRAAPPVRHVTPSGRPMRVAMTAAGKVGWVSDKDGYRYASRHASGAPWPPIPPRLLGLWAWLLPDARLPESCLVNHYDASARMGLHQDRDEADLTQPVLSISLGDAAQFRVGGTTRGGPTTSVWLESGDVLALLGPSRLAYHGIDKLRPGSSTLLPEGGRINLTLRVVT